MKKALKTLFFAGCAIAAASFVSCGKNKEEQAALDPSQPVELTIWTHEDQNRTELEQQLIKEFQQDNPNITVNYVTYPSGKIKDILVAGFAANQGPDIFNIEINDEYPFVINGRVAPVDVVAAGFKNQKELVASYMDKMLDPVTMDGKVYGLPLELTNWCIYLNKKIFKDAGLDPEKDAPKTWEDIVAVSKKIAIHDGEIITRRGFDFRYPYYLISWVPMVEQLGGKLVSDDGKKAIINDEAWLTALRYMKDFGPSGENLGSPTYTAARKIFDNNQNEIAMSLSGLYQEQRMASTNPSFFNSDEWMVIPYPQWKNAKQTVPCHYYGHYYMVNAQKSAAQRTAAWKLLGFMLSHSEEYLKKVAIVQPTKALFESDTFKEMPYSEVFKKDLESGSIVYYAENSPKIDSLLKNAVESVMLSGTSPETALADLRKNVQAVLDEE
ncbi:MAG: extracellular solute-binding protein [Treponema sp.]|nr:extracellular solute-binding protein [Treponema sp.]